MALVPFFLIVSVMSLNCHFRRTSSEKKVSSAKRMRTFSSVSFEEDFVNTLIDNMPSLKDSALLLKATRVFGSFLRKWEIVGPAEDALSSETVSRRAVLAAATFRRVAAGDGKLRTRKDLQRAASDFLGEEPSTATISSLSLVLATLALTATDGNRASSRSAASAIALTLEDAIASEESFQTTFYEELVFAVISLAAKKPSEYNELAQCSGTMIDLHIVSSLARSVNVNSCSTLVAAQATAATVRNVLRLGDADSSALLKAEPISQDSANKTEVAAALALASQLGPWKILQATILIEVAVLFDLWHAAERICHSVANCEEFKPAGVKAVHALIDAAFTARSYRQADTFATKFFAFGAESRFLNARFLHACDTISKVIHKRALPVVERQVERVDKAVEKISGFGLVLDDPSLDVLDGAGTSFVTASQDIRNFALRQLEENGDTDAAHRLANIWNMEYTHDEDAMKAAVAARRQKYLQWYDLLPGQAVPELLSTPEALVNGFSELGRQIVYGFDVEWGDDCTGAALLQIGTSNAVILVDILALSNTVEGADALERTVGGLFASSRCVVIGFGCRQDLARLRSSSCVRAKHWFGETSAVVDLQALVTKPVGKEVGLSKCCDFFLLKPLDKSEQCSDWTNRPLTEQQRVYASLDAYVCALIYTKHFAGDDNTQCRPQVTGHSNPQQTSRSP